MALVACGSSGGSAVVAGNVGPLSVGKALSVTSSALALTSCQGLGTGWLLSVTISDASLVCSSGGPDGSLAAGAVALGINIQAPSPRPGKYFIGVHTANSIGSADADIRRLGDDMSGARATSGFVVIDSVDGDAVSGSFQAGDFEYDPAARVGAGAPPADTSGSLSGTFSAAPCHVVGGLCLQSP